MKNGVLLIYIAQVCGDPIKGVYTILLTARVYNSSNTGNSTGIYYIRSHPLRARLELGCPIHER